MSDPWAEFKPAGAVAPQTQGPPAVDPWAEFAMANPSPSQLGVPTPSATPRASQAYTGSVLPFSVDAQGKARFDSNAGILGSLKSAFMLPGDVATGKVDPYSDEGKSRAMELAAFASPINPAVRAGDWAIPGASKSLQPARTPVPTVQELKAAGGRGFDAVRDMGVDYSSDAVARMAQGLKANLERDGILAELAPKTHSVIDRLTSPPSGSVAPISGIEAARRSLGRLSKSLDDVEKEAARRVVEGVDEFITAADPSTVVAGPAAAAGRALTEARGNWGAGKRAQQLLSTEEAAGLRAAAANSGANGDNAIRQRIASLLISPNKLRGFSGAERDALTGVVEGTAARNAVRTAGNLMGGGGGLGGTFLAGSGGVLGTLLGGPVGGAIGASVPAVGWGVKRLGSNLTRRALNSADEMVRMRSPLYEGRVAAAGMEGTPNASRDLIARLLLGQSIYGR